MDAKLLARVVRQAFPGRNQLATAGDRLEGVVLVAAVVVALLALPVVGVVGSEVYAAQLVQSASERQTRLLFGTTGRADLLGKQHADILAHQQYSSVRRLADLLPDGAEVWPTHGFGSFCSAAQADAPSSTIGREKATNSRLGA